MIALKIAIVAGVVLAAAAAMRRQSAASRHTIVAAGVLCAAAIPWIEKLVPGWGAALAVASYAAPPHYVSGSTLRLIWIGGSAVALATLAAGIAQLAWIRSRAHRSSRDDWAALVDEIACEYDIHRTVVVLESDAAAMPMTWGILRPRILLPPTAHRWSAGRLRAVLAHELAHVRRGDWAVRIAVESIVCVYWWNPLLWIARRRLLVESERACDDIVVTGGADAAEYASHLVAIAREVRSRRFTSAPAPAMARAGLLESRIAAVLDAGMNRTPLSSAAVLAAAIALAAVTVPVAGFGIPAAPPAQTRLLDVHRQVMMRFGGEEWRFSIAAREVSFWKNRLEGRVELQARLTVDGSLDGVRLLEPAHPDLASAAEVIVRHWRREPARLRGVPVEVPIRMTVDFRR